MLATTPDQNALLEALKAIVGPRGYRLGEDVEARYYRDVMGARAEPPLILLRPASTAEVVAIFRTCHAHLQPVAVQGGMTGLVSAAAPLVGEVALA